MQPTINQYLLSTSLFIIDEINEMYSGMEKPELKEISDTKYNEMDITVRLGYPFRNMIHYTVGDSGSKRQNSKINHDLYVESKDFKIEVKYLRNWASNGNDKYRSNKIQWAEIEKDFKWLEHEIEMGNKGKRAFIIAWFNCIDNFSQYMQLGCSAGNNPIASEDRVSYFPFLASSMAAPRKASDLGYNYQLSYRELPVNTYGRLRKNNELNCMFIGNENDCFHIAMYY